jgi:hypothetical protein
MDKFITRENIQHFHDRLETETDPAIRLRLHRFLVEEEDKLGRNSEALHQIERHIVDAKKRVNRQQSMVASIERDGGNTAHALTLLKAFGETLLLFENHRQAILIALDQSSL